MTHCFGGTSDGGYCVPQAVQMKAGISVPYCLLVIAGLDPAIHEASRLSQS
jgi:hypothetical protein